MCALPPLPNKAHLRPVWPLRRWLSNLREKRKQLEPAMRAKYQEGYREIARANRRELVARMVGHPPERTIVVTHGRLTKTAQDMPVVPLFLFGHSHGFTDTRTGRSRFINVSALDHVVPVMPKHATKRIWNETRAADIGAYTIIEIDDQIVVVSYPLRSMPLGWERVSGSTIGLGFKPLNQGEALLSPKR